MLEKLTVTTVCSVHHNQKRPTYSKMWVDRLYAGIKRNLDIPFEFVCFSNDIESDDYRIEPLTTDSWGWWNKLEQFKKSLFTGPVLSLDLDIVICKNLTDGLNALPKNSLLMLREPHEFQPDQSIENSSVVFWDGDYSFLFDNYVAHKDEICNQYASPLNKRMSDQGYIAESVDVKFIDDYVPANYMAWKHHITGDRNIDNDPTLLIFTSTEKPTNNGHLKLVKENWF
jgi:hypothetical protein